MEEDGPLVPGIFERALQLLLIAHHAEAALLVLGGEPFAFVEDEGGLLGFSFLLARLGDWGDEF